MGRRVFTKVRVPHLGHPVVEKRVDFRPSGKFLEETALSEISCRVEDISRIVRIRQPRPSPSDRTVETHGGEVALANVQRLFMVLGEHLKDCGVKSCVQVPSSYKASLDASIDQGAPPPWLSSLLQSEQVLDH